MDDANGLLSPSASTKRGRDPIFAMLSKCQAAAAAGADVVNGTIGALLEDDGTLAINATYVDALKAHHAVMQTAMKAKQSATEAAVDALDHAVGDFAKMYVKD